MSADTAYLTLKNYLESRATSRAALSFLDEGTEVGFVIGGSLECAVFQKEGQVQIERRLAHDPALIVNIRPETVYILDSQTSLELRKVGISIFKEMLSGGISLKFTHHFPKKLQELLLRAVMGLRR